MSDQQENLLAPICFTPIGVFESDQIEPYQAARQPDTESEPGIIHLRAGHNYEQALKDLDGCSHLWIIYHFHHNDNWKPLVLTPRSKEKIGVFATRAPYRPNAIGMTVTTLEKIEGLKIHIGPNDILHGSPILDIKPYHPEYDVVTDAKINWLEQNLEKHKITFSPVAKEQIEFLQSHGLKEINPFIFRQLQYDPTNSDKKRVEEKQSFWTLSYRTWRIDFILVDNIVSVIGLRSGYSVEELHRSDDLYNDKQLHQSFCREFD